MSVFHKMRNGTGVTYMVEFQMQPDEDIYPRVCVMRGLYKQRMNPHYVFNVILFLNKNCDPRTHDFEWMFNGCTTDFQVLYLDQVVKKLADAQPEHPLLAILGPLMEPSEEVVLQKHDTWTRQILGMALPEEDTKTLLTTYMTWFLQKVPFMKDEILNDDDRVLIERRDRMLANLFVKCGLDNEKDRALASPHIKPSPTLRMINKIADRHFKINKKLEKLLQKGLIDQEEYEELALPYIKVPLGDLLFPT